MKLLVPLTAFAAIAGMALPTVAFAARDPGPGWTRWREHRYDHKWDGPAWVNTRGKHYGWYRWRNSYYQNCSWRWEGQHHREWRCW